MNRDKTIKILWELKHEYHKRPDQLRIPINDDKNNIIAYLRPISENLGKDEQKYIKLLSEWRAANWLAYPTVFKVTENGTKKWIQDQLINREDRLLFMIVTLDDRPVGHLGLSNFNYEEQEAEIDNVVRGVDNVLPGLFTHAMNAIDRWAFTELGLKRLFLRVFYDNPRAIKLYERCGFRGVKKIPLHKTVEKDTVKYEEIPEGQDLSVDREFYLMELKGKIQ